MEPQNLRFGGGATDTVLHPLIAVEMALAIILILCLPRKTIIAPFLWMIFTVPIGQVLVAGGVHFTVIRIIILAGLARWVVSGRSQSAGRLEDGLNSIDRVFILWAVSELVISSIQLMQTQALIQSCGDFLDLLGGYMVVRFMIQDRDDVLRAIKVFAVIASFMACCMMGEKLTGKNVFGMLGGAPLTPQVRAGAIRAQGAFASYIEAGVFGANLIPLFVLLWSQRKSRIIALMGIIGGATMVVTCASSTPLLGLAAAMLGFFLFYFRSHMRVFRQALVFLVVTLHVVMKAPVWALIQRVDVVGSSSGFHRFMLVDNCIRHFSEWWLLGYQNYASWGWDMWDLSDQYVSVCLTGGLISLIVFVSILSRSFSALGKARKHVAGDRKEEWILWCLGVSLFADLVVWLGYACWAKGEAALSALLAMISVATFEAMRKSSPQDEEALVLEYEDDSGMNWVTPEINQ
jgi:hypothetical protein